MDNTLRENKRIIRSFMHEQYTDAKLVELLDHARAGKLVYTSCCCFIGIPTADHELKGESADAFYAREARHRGAPHSSHYYAAMALPNAHEAEQAFLAICSRYGLGSYNPRTGRRILIPMILAELKRRNQLSKISVLLPEESQEKV